MAFTKQRRGGYGNQMSGGNIPPVQGNTAVAQKNQQWNGNPQRNGYPQNQYQQPQNLNPMAPPPSQMPPGNGQRQQAPAQQGRINHQNWESNNQPQNPSRQRVSQNQQGQMPPGVPQAQQPPYSQWRNQAAPQPQLQNPASERIPENPAPESETTSFVSTKIWKVNGKDKVVDFSSKLTKAFEQDFANVHGIGGSDHAPNSTICVTICDFTKGKGDKSTTVKYAVDVEDMAMLYQAAMAARLGFLKMIPPLDMGNNNCVFSYSKQKNNPYSTTKMNGVEYAPVSQIGIYYDPSRNYPWIIQITNCEAPIKQKANGANTHNSSQAINVQEAFIYLSADDFCASMVAVDRFVRLWEQRMFRTVDAGCKKYEEAIEELKNKKNKSG